MLYFARSLYGNQITTLPDGIFADLAALTNVFVYDY